MIFSTHNYNKYPDDGLVEINMSVLELVNRGYIQTHWMAIAATNMAVGDEQLSDLNPCYIRRTA